MVLIAITYDFCLEISNLEIRLLSTIKYDFMAPCSPHFSWFPLKNHDSTDALANCISLVITIEDRKQIPQGHTGLM